MLEAGPISIRPPRLRRHVHDAIAQREERSGDSGLGEEVGEVVGGVDVRHGDAPVLDRLTYEKYDRCALNI